jgi:methyl-accepting chemotaxis protein
MRPEQIALIEESFEQVLPIADAAAEIFYTRLFTLDPSLRALFPDDLRDQRQKLMAMLNTAVRGLRRPDKLLPVLRQLGARHVDYGVLPEHYETVGQALLDTLAQGLGPAFTGEVEEAWREAYMLIADTMQADVPFAA